MKHLVPIIALAFATTALAQGSSGCSSEAAARKLSGTAKAEFLRSCEAKARAQLVATPKEAKMPSGAMSMAPTRASGECGHSQADL